MRKERIHIIAFNWFYFVVTNSITIQTCRNGHMSEWDDTSYHPRFKK